jgi:hypothetical protein
MALGLQNFGCGTYHHHTSAAAESDSLRPDTWCATVLRYAGQNMATGFLEIPVWSLATIWRVRVCRLADLSDEPFVAGRTTDKSSDDSVTT